MLWAKQKRLQRILAAIDQLSADGRRWQAAVKLDPEQFDLAQGVQAGQPVIRVGLAADAVQHLKNTVQALGARAALRGLSFIDDPEQESITLHPWTEGITLAAARWGGPYKQTIPDAHLCAPVDGVFWKNAREDAIVGRNAIAGLETLLSQAARQPVAQMGLLMITASFGAAAYPLPEAWLNTGRQPIVTLFRGALSGLVRSALGGGADAVLIGELAASTFARHSAIELPQEVEDIIQEDARTWRDRATPPIQLIEKWQDAISALPVELLDHAYDAALKDQVTEAALAALLTRDSAVALENAGYWREEAGTVQAQQIVALLQKLDPESFAKIQQSIKDQSGRFKAKQRRQVGADYLARMALLATFDRWFKQFSAENHALLEISSEDDARLSEEVARGGMYAFSLTLDTTSASVEATAFQTGHLFADLKGFTAMTALLAEQEIRQFLRQNFYEPLIRIAKDYFKGGTDLADRGGIRLNNLLGDAISLSGEPTDLLQFAERATKLVRDGIGEIVQRQSQQQAAEASQQTRDVLTAQLNQLKVQKAQSNNGTEIEAQIRRIEQQLAAQSDGTDVGIELDFGFFVSFGAAPVDLTIEDDIFGSVYVALADKINESARGVERDSAVQQALQAYQVQQSGKPLAFRIHVGPTFSGVLPDAFLETWPTSPEEAEMLATSVPGGLKTHGTTGMYNVGIGLSAETAEQVVRGLSGQPIFEWRGKTQELSAPLCETFLIPEPRQQFILLEWDQEFRILRHCGNVMMKGFQSPPPVWEWVGPWMDVYSPLLAFLQSEAAPVDHADIAGSLHL